MVYLDTNRNTFLLITTISSIIVQAIFLGEFNRVTVVLEVALLVVTRSCLQILDAADVAETTSLDGVSKITFGLFERIVLESWSSIRRQHRMTMVVRH